MQRHMDVICDTYPREDVRMMLERIISTTTDSRTATLCLLWLRRLEGHEAFPGYQAITQASPFEQCAVRRSVKTLLERGELTLTECGSHSKVHLRSEPLNGRMASMKLNSTPQELPHSTTPPSTETKNASGTKGPPTKRRRRKSPNKSVDGSGLESAELRLVCANLVTMGTYLMKGKNALVPHITTNECETGEDCTRYWRDLNALNLPDTRLNWRQYGPHDPKVPTDYRPNFEAFPNVDPWAGYFWYHISWVRNKKFNSSIFLPQWKRYKNWISRMLQTMRPEDVFQYMWDCTYDYPCVMQELGSAWKRIGVGEGLLTHQMANGCINGLPRIQTPERVDLRAKGLAYFHNQTGKVW